MWTTSGALLAPVLLLIGFDFPFTFSPDGKRSAILQEDGLHVREGKKDLWKSDAELAGRATDLRFSPDGRLLAVSYPNVILVREAATGKSRLTIPLQEDDDHHLGWSRDGRMLAVAGLNQSAVSVWEVATGLIRQRLHLDEPLLVSFAPDGRHLATAQPGGELRIFELGADKASLELKANEEEAIGALTLSPDGSRLAASQGLVIRVWDMTGKQIALIRGPERPAELVFSQDGRLLRSLGKDGTAKNWEVPPATARLRSTSLPWQEDLWQRLADEDAARAFQAMRTLRSHPKLAIELFQARLTRTGEVNQRGVDRLLADLDSDEFSVREKAEGELRSLGAAVEFVLRDAREKTSSTEVRRAIERVLESIEGKAYQPEQIRKLRAVEVLEAIGTPEARHMLEKLGKGRPGRLTTLAREALERLANNSFSRSAARLTDRSLLESCSCNCTFPRL